MTKSLPPDGAGLEVVDLEVRYTGFVLGPVSLRLAGGQVFCLLGPNGSGKTTLMRSMLGLQQTDRGGTTWNGQQLAARPPAVFAGIGYVTDSAEDMIPELAPQEYWEYCALAYSRHGRDPEPMLARAGELAEQLDFVPPRRSVSSFSLGMRRKAQLIAGLMHSPELIVLDEPLIGLDFLSVRALEDVLESERERGAVVVVSSHDLGVAARLADRIAVLHLGRMILDGPLDSVTAGGALEDVVERIIRSARRGDA
jgi:ABC-2 type transport system ATP-binding protein